MKKKLAPTGLRTFTLRSNMAILVAVSLSACVSTKEQLANQRADDDATCVSYGLKFGTSDYAQCRQHIVDKREAERIARTAAQAEVARNLANPRPTALDIYLANQRRSLNCTTNYFGASANTNCH